MGEETKHSDTRDRAAMFPEVKKEPSHFFFPMPIPRRWFPMAVLLTGLILTLLAAYYAARTIQLRTRVEFETAAMRARATIRARFDVYQALLHGVAGFVAVDKGMTRERFKNYVSRLRIAESYPGLQSIGFAPRIAAPDKQIITASMIEQGEGNFRIWPETDHPDFYPVIYVEPQTPRNNAAVGYDMFAEPTRREAMERARDIGDTAASGKLILITELAPDMQPGFLIYCPVYEGGTVPETIPGRRAKLEGFAFGVFRTGDLFSSIFRDEAMEAELEIYDGTNLAATNLLFRSAEENLRSSPFRRTFQEKTVLDMSGRTWTVRFFARPEMEGNWIVPSLICGGVILSFIMFYLTSAEHRARQAAEQAATELQISELALRESEERLRRYATELEHRVAERTANLAQSIQSLEGVLYHVAHDLRAPLRGMASFTSILLDEYAAKLDDRGRDYAQRISNAAQRMDRLVQDLLAYGRLTHTAVPITHVSLETEVQAALAHFTEEIEDRGATIEVVRSLPPVKANAAVLNQILSNLFSNALKFMKPEVRPHLRIHAEETTSRLESVAAKSNGAPSHDAQAPVVYGKFVRLWVEDNGIGISPEYHERIFRMFERLHGAGSYPGTGIGLAIVRKGVERMGGRSGVESATGMGSRFWIELPAA